MRPRSTIPSPRYATANTAIPAAKTLRRGTRSDHAPGRVGQQRVRQVVERVDEHDAGEPEPELLRPKQQQRIGEVHEPEEREERDDPAVRAGERTGARRDGRGPLVMRPWAARARTPIRPTLIAAGMNATKKSGRIS